VTLVLENLSQPDLDIGIPGAQNSIAHFAHAFAAVNPSPASLRIDDPHRFDAEGEVVVCRYSSTDIRASTAAMPEIIPRVASQARIL